MSLRGKDFRCEIEQELHEQLRIMADFQNKTIQILGAEIFEEAIAGKFHTFSVRAERLQRSGIFRSGGGTTRKIAEAYLDRQEKEHD